MRSIKIFLVVLLFGMKALAGGSETHGGDIIIGEFKDLSLQLTQDLRQLPTSWLPRYDFITQWENLADEVVIETQERVFFQGREVQAINISSDGHAKIILSRSLWQYSAQKHSQYERLVLHEYLPLLGLVDDDYRYSQELLQSLNLARHAVIDKHFVAKAFESPEMCQKILQFVKHRPGRAVEKPAELVLSIVWFGKDVLSNFDWEDPLNQLAGLIYSKIPADRKVKDPHLECAVSIADRYVLPWFYEVNVDIRDIYPNAKCSLPLP